MQVPRWRQSVRRIVLAASLAAAPGAAHAQAPTEVDKLVASDAQMLAQLGFSVDLDGDTALATALYKDSPVGSLAGSAYVFTYDGSSWSQQAELTSTDTYAGQTLGLSGTLAGDTAVVGAPFDRAAKGAAYVFVRAGTTWTQQAKLTASDGAGNDLFGWSMAICGDTLVVGAFQDSHPGGSGAGSAYVFERGGTTWVEQAKLTASDASSSAQFGFSAGIDGDTLVVGANADSLQAVLAGSAYVFTRSGAVWAEQAKLTSSDLAGLDHFGQSVAISGDRVAVGAYSDDLAPNAGGGPSGEGSAYVFVRNGTSWSEQRKLAASDALQGDNFGFTVDIDGDVIAVGARQRDDFGMESGSAYVYSTDGVGWTEDAKLSASDAATEHRFGNAVALSGGSLLIGSSADDSTPGGTDAGSAYVFSLNDGDVETYCAGKPNSVGCVPFVGTVGVPSASATGAFQILAHDVVPGGAGVLLYAFKKANLDFHGGKLCVKLPFVRTASKAPKNTGAGCSGWMLRRNFNAILQSGADPGLTPGRSVTAQWRQRDVADPAGFGDGLTDAVRFTIQP